jgi:hypothetical protein
MDKKQDNSWFFLSHREHEHVLEQPDPTRLAHRRGGMRNRDDDVQHRLGRSPQAEMLPAVSSAALLFAVRRACDGGASSGDAEGGRRETGR